MKYRLPIAIFGVLLWVSGWPVTSFADWDSDEAYIKQLEQYLNELEASVDLFGTYLRTLDMVEAEVSNLQLPLADPQQNPELLVRQILKKSYPKVQMEMHKLSASAPEGAEIWRWRCQLSGPVEELRWATQLLRQKGLFILPSLNEPMELRLEVNQRWGKLRFIGQHVRLSFSNVLKLPNNSPGDDALAHRTDPLADRIKELQREISSLREKMMGIMGFEMRLDAVKIVIAHLQNLAKSAEPPFRPVTPLLDFDLIQYQSIIHQGKVIKISGKIPSLSARPAILQWLRKRGTPKIRYQVDKLEPLLYSSPLKNLPIPTDARKINGPKCDISFGEARPLDIATALALFNHTAVVVRESKPGERITGQVKAMPLREAFAAGVKALHLSLIHNKAYSLIIPSEQVSLAEASLAGSPASLLKTNRTISSKKGIDLWRGATMLQMLDLVQQEMGITVEIPISLKDANSLIFIGSTSPLNWLRLFGAAMAYRLENTARPSTVKFVPVNSAPNAQLKAVAAVAPDHEYAESNQQLNQENEVSLSQLQVHLLLVCPTKKLGIVSTLDGPPQTIFPGSALGKGHSRVISLSPHGVTVRWSNAGFKTSVLLPLHRTIKKKSPRQKVLSPANANPGKKAKVKKKNVH